MSPKFNLKKKMMMRFFGVENKEQLKSVYDSLSDEDKHQADLVAKKKIGGIAHPYVAAAMIVIGRKGKKRTDKSIEKTKDKVLKVLKREVKKK
jgi:hypothetical protein